VPELVIKLVVTPLLIGAASLAGRRWGHAVGGWLVGLPLTSGPVAFVLALDQGVSFAAGAAVGMLAGTVSQVAFALTYRHAAGRTRRGWWWPLLAGCLGFAVATGALAALPWSAPPTFGLVVAALVVGIGLTWQGAAAAPPVTVPAPRWEIPVRMLVATGVVVAITGLAPILGARVAGLLSPFPVFAAVLTIFAHRAHGAVGATGVLAGLLLGLFAPAVFFLTLAVALPAVGLVAFAIATVAALVVQAATMLAMRRSPSR
jgi:hypothetical protein